VYLAVRSNSPYRLQFLVFWQQGQSGHREAEGVAGERRLWEEEEEEEEEEQQRDMGLILTWLLLPLLLQQLQRMTPTA
jgi:hypothetical protein